MKLVKSLLLATAGGLVAVSGASAADLGGIRKPAPAEYVRVCNAYGAGFFYIPGTQTCLRISGRARFEGQYQTRFNRDDTSTGYRAIGRIALDARTQSEYGPVRAFVRVDTAYRTGVLGSGSATRYYNASNNNNTAAGNGMTTQLYPELESAFVQFAGITAGKLASFFDFNAATADAWIGIGGSGTFTPIQLAYTATFGSGFSATLAIEDPSSRRNTTAYFSGAGPTVWGYGGGNVPDVVAALRVDQGWGSAQLSGLLHQVNYAAYNTVLGGGLAGTGAAPSSDYGFAIQGGVNFKLPMLAPGDQIMLTGTYSKGAVNTVIGVDCGYGSINQCAFGNAGSFTSRLAYTDGVVTGFGSTKLTTAYGITASLRHYWAPTIRQSFWGSYTKVDYAASTGFADTTLWRVGSNIVWSPIKDLEMGPEVMYTNIRGGNGYATNGVAKGDPIFGKGTEDLWQFRFRVQRDF